MPARLGPNHREFLVVINRARLLVRRFQGRRGVRWRNDGMGFVRVAML